MRTVARGTLVWGTVLAACTAAMPQASAQWDDGRGRWDDGRGRWDDGRGRWDRRAADNRELLRGGNYRQITIPAGRQATFRFRFNSARENAAYVLRDTRRGDLRLLESATNQGDSGLRDGGQFTTRVHNRDVTYYVAGWNRGDRGGGGFLDRILPGEFRDRDRGRDRGGRWIPSDSVFKRWEPRRGYYSVGFEDGEDRDFNDAVVEVFVR